MTQRFGTGFAALLLIGLYSPEVVAQTSIESSANSRPHSLKGRVLDHQGRPVSGAKVVIADADNGFIDYWGPNSLFTYAPTERVLLFFPKHNGRREGEAVTDQDGDFTFKGLRYGTYNLLAVHAEWGVGILSKFPYPKDTDTVELTLDEPAFVEGRLRGFKMTPDYLALHGMARDDQISFVPQIKRKEDGRYRVGPLPAESKWTLLASRYVKKQAYSANLLSLPVSVKPGETTKLDVDLSHGERIEGKVVGPTGKPLSGVSVVARTVGEPAAEFGAITDRYGRYAIAGLAKGDYVLESKRWVPRTGPG